jgi:hypothetical protein
MNPVDHLVELIPHRLRNVMLLSCHNTNHMMCNNSFDPYENG